MRCLQRNRCFFDFDFKMEKLSDLREYDDNSSDDSLDGIVDQVIMYYINFILYTKLMT